MNSVSWVSMRVKILNVNKSNKKLAVSNNKLYIADSIVNQ